MTLPFVDCWHYLLSTAESDASFGKISFQEWPLQKKFNFVWYAIDCLAVLNVSRAFSYEFMSLSFDLKMSVNLASMKEHLSVCNNWRCRKIFFAVLMTWNQGKFWWPLFWQAEEWCLFYQFDVPKIRLRAHRKMHFWTLIFKPNQSRRLNVFWMCWWCSFGELLAISIFQCTQRRKEDHWIRRVRTGCW